MRAGVYEAYGPPGVVEVRDVDTPAPKDDEVLIAVHATTVTASDVRMRALRVPRGLALPTRLALGLLAPRRKILGAELSGVVVAVGRKVTRFAVGTPVFGMSDTYAGAHAEYRTFPERGALAEKPANVSFHAAAALCFGGTTALDFLRRAGLRRGERLLVNGASGAVGSATVQLAKYFGAHVSAVCSTANVDLVRSLGADAVLDCTRVDFTQNGERYDLVMDTAGTAPWARSKRSLAPGGRLLLVIGGLTDLLGGLWVSMTTRHRVISGTARVAPSDVRLLAQLAAEGVYRPVLDRVYPLERLADAHAYVDAGHKRGNVVVDVERDTPRRGEANRGDHPRVRRARAQLQEAGAEGREGDPNQGDLGLHEESGAVSAGGALALART